MARIQTLSPEVLLQIVSHLGSDGQTSSQDMVSLAALARVCRCLSEPALNMLWSHLSSIVPLIFTMPRDLWVIEVRKSKGGSRKIVKFTRTLQASDYTRLLEYASRVKALHDTSIWRDVILDESAWAALEHSDFAPQLFPRLRSLALTVNCSVALVPVHILVSPVLRQLSVYVRNIRERGGHLRHGLKRLFEKLCSINPPIRHLSLEFHHCNCRKYQTLLTALLCFKTLTTIQTSYTPIGASALAILSHLPYLRDLQVRVAGSGQDIVGTFSGLRSPRPFRSLARAAYTVEDMAIIHCLLRFASSRSLTHIDVCMLTDVSPEDAQEFTHLVTLHHPLLEQLELRLRDPIPRYPNDPDEVPPDQKPLPTDVLAPLFGLRQLSRLNMGSCPVVVDDSLVARMAMAWPGLVTLELCSTFHGFDHLGVRPPTRIRLSALVPLFESCKKLRRLGLPLDTRITTSITALDDKHMTHENAKGASQGVSLPCLTDLLVGWSEIEEHDVGPVASFLSDHLPALSKVTEGWQSAFVYEVVAEEDVQGAMLFEVRWRQVASLVRGLHLVRQQERNWDRSAEATAQGAGAGCPSTLDASQD